MPVFEDVKEEQITKTYLTERRFELLRAIDAVTDGEPPTPITEILADHEDDVSPPVRATLDHHLDVLGALELIVTKIPVDFDEEREGRKVQITDYGAAVVDTLEATDFDPPGPEDTLGVVVDEDAPTLPRELRLGEIETAVLAGLSDAPDR